MKQQLNSLSQLGQLNTNATQKAPAQRQEPRQQAQRPMERQYRPLDPMPRPERLKCNDCGQVNQRVDRDACCKCGSRNLGMHLHLGLAIAYLQPTEGAALWLSRPKDYAIVFDAHNKKSQWRCLDLTDLNEIRLSWPDRVKKEDPSRVKYFKRTAAALEFEMIQRGLCVPVVVNPSQERENRRAKLANEKPVDLSGMVRLAHKEDLISALVADDARERAERHVHLQASQSQVARNKKRADSKMKSLRARARAAGLSDIIRLKAEVNGDQWMLADAGIPELTPFWVEVAIRNKDRAYALSMQAGTGESYWAEVHAKAKAEQVRIEQERVHSAIIARFKERAVIELLKGVVEEVKRSPKPRAGYSDSALTEFYGHEFPLTLPEQVLAEFRHYADQQIQPPSLKPVPAQRGRQEEPVLVERIKRTRAEVVQEAYRKVQASPRLDGSRGRKQAYLAERLIAAGAIADEPAIKTHAVKMAAAPAKPKGALNLLQATVAQPRRLK